VFGVFWCGAPPHKNTPHPGFLRRYPLFLKM
jgi:hypothetical protein